jgi:Gas vesicle protein
MTSPTPAAAAAPAATPGHEPANLGDILERVLDRGIVIAGDIQVNLLDIELLTVKLRLVIASVDTAREMGIDWWETDPWLTGRARAAVDGAPRAAQVTSGNRARRDDQRRDDRSLTASQERRDD